MWQLQVAAEPCHEKALMVVSKVESHHVVSQTVLGWVIGTSRIRNKRSKRTHEFMQSYHAIAMDFLEASPLRIETADGETHIIAQINGKKVIVSESSIRRKLKLKDEEGINDSHREAFPTATSLDAGQDRENIPKTSAMPHEHLQGLLLLRGMMDQGEDFGIERDSNKSTNKESESTWGMANVLSSMGAANILASGGLKEVFTTASPPVPHV
ncbi:hypothetical protein Tco_0823200 [Tanacetum coccineum]|uniref:Uncharacterized protein n=1 Tax=Tanacetum coccineum TaxID=301880 RepID=A0ABQ5AH84_9ASTR